MTALCNFLINPSGSVNYLFLSVKIPLRKLINFSSLPRAMERIDHGYSATQEYPHPFIHKMKLTRAQRIRVTLKYISI